MSSERLAAALADRYRLERELGQGGMATVYLAEDLKHQRKVAVKVLRPELAAALGHDRFLREITTTANLRHPHILPLYDSGEAGGFLFYVMPFVEGESLRDRLARDRQLSIADALQITREAADALGYAHEQGIIHRDIKPDNILLERGHAVVADFGIARAVSSAGANKLTQTGMAIGTPAYMSPEQSVGEADLDARSDLYALGCVLYEMLAGEPPYNGPTAQAIIAKRFREPVPQISTLRETVPPGVEAALNRVLAKSPADRFATAEEFSAALEAPGPGEHARPEGVEKFWVAVLPFKYGGANADLIALAEGLTEEVITGLSRFSYIRVTARSSTLPFAGEAVDARSVGTKLGARYVIEGSLRQAGSALRLSVQLVDTNSGAHIWAETYDRPFQPESIFALQDDLVPRIVSTVADAHGILPHTLSEALRNRHPDQLTPYEAVLRSFGYGYRMTPEEHAAVRDILERAVRQAPGYSDAWGMLSLVYAEEFSNGFNPRPDPLGRALQAARRAADAAPSNALAHNALARALFFRKEFQAFRIAADRALELNPLNGPALAALGSMMAYAGDWEHGCAQVERAARLNPRHPGGYWFAPFYNAYRQGDYRGALSVGLKINLPDFFATYEAMAAAYGQLGERDAAARSLRELLRLKPDGARTLRDELGKWFDPELTEHVLDGLRKAGLEVEPTPGSGSPPTAADAAAPTTSGATRADEGFWVAVLPFKYSGTNPDLTALAEGLTEETVTGLSRFSYLKVVARSSTPGQVDQALDVRSAGRASGARYLMEGSLRQSGSRLRIAVQLVDATSGANLWAESYDRSFSPEALFELQDDVVPRIVSTVADMNGVLPHFMSEALRARDPARLTPDEAVLRSLGYTERITAEEHAVVRAALERAVEAAPSHADGWAMLSFIYAEEHKHGFNPLPDSLGRALEAARRAVAAAPANQLAYHVLAQAHFFRGEFAAFRNAADRAVALNPMDGCTIAFMGILMGYAGDWEHGCALAERAMQLNPHHPGWYRFASFWKAYRTGDHRAALEVALKFNMPSYFYTHMALAMAYGSLGDREGASRALQELLAQKPDFARTVRKELGKWVVDPALLEQALDGLREAGLEGIE